MSKKTCLVTVFTLLFCLCSSQAFAKKHHIYDPDSLGLGVGIGALAYGFGAKYYFSPDSAIQGNMGVQPTQSRAVNGSLFAIGADYLFEFGPISSANNIDLTLGIGPGLATAVSTLGYVAFDVNACFSFQILFHELPLDFALEYRPAIRFKSAALYNEPGRLVYAPDSFGIQMRYYLFDRW